MTTQTAPRAGATFDRRLVAPMIFGSILNPVNSSMIAVALIPIGTYFGAPPAQTAWLVSALYLATAVGQPVVGRLVDMYGPRRLYLIGAALIGVGGALGALAPHLGYLIAARVLIGFGTCAGYPAAMYLIRSEARRTGQDSPAVILTVLAVATQTIAVAGPTIGGLLIGVGGWRAIFTVNVPLALACLLLGALRLPKSPAAPRTESLAKAVDLPGITLFATTLITLLLFLMSPALWYLLLVCVATAVVFTWWELHAVTPFLDLRVLGGNYPLLATYGRTLLSYTVSYAFLYGFTQWLEEGRGLSASHAGLLLLPVFVTGIGVSALTGRRTQVRAKLLVGALAQLAACGLLLTLGGNSPIWLLVALGLILGIPQGLTSLANQNALYYQAEPARMGSSAGLLRTFMYLGAMVSSAANGAFFGPRADTGGLHHLAIFLLVIAAVFLAVTVLDRSLSRVGTAPPETPAPAEATAGAGSGAASLP